MERRKRRRFLQLLFIFSLASCSIFAPRLITNEPYFSFPNALSSQGVHSAVEPERILLSSNGGREITAKETSLSCDRSAFSSDVCVLSGDVRTSPSTSSILLYSRGSGHAGVQVEKIRPYTRKWETSIMRKIQELNLVVLHGSSSAAHHCDVVHQVPAVVFSTGGYIGNVYHDFRDCMVPLFITSSHFRRQVVFLVVNPKKWWYSKYQEILSHLSAYPPIEFSLDNRTHCFPEVTVGLRVHGELAVDPSLTTPLNQTINDFQRLLSSAYRHRIRHRDQDKDRAARPTLVTIFRKGSRAVENEKELVELCKKVGFGVQVLRPNSRMKLADIYQVLNAADAMIGVVGCALTHLLFMRPGSVFIQVKLLGTEWAAEANYGDPAKKIGLKYIPYQIKPSESSLSRIYPKDDPVLTDPESISSKGWDVTKRIFLDKQTVRLDLNRFNETLNAAFNFLAVRKKVEDNSDSRSET